MPDELYVAEVIFYYKAPPAEANAQGKGQELVTSRCTGSGVSP